MPEHPQVIVVPDLRPATFSDGLVAAWGPRSAFLITSPNVYYLPQIVEGVVYVYLRQDGTFGIHDPMLWPQIYDSQCPYLCAIPKSLSPLADAVVEESPPSPLWSPPRERDFVYLPNTPIRCFGRFSGDFIHSIEPMVTAMSSKVRDYAPTPPDLDLTSLRTFEQLMVTAWHRVRFMSATYRDQMAQLGVVRRYWLLCSAFMTYNDLLAQPPSLKPRPVDHQLMGAWTSDPQVVQKLTAMGVPVWFVRTSTCVSPDIRVGNFVAVTSPKSLCSSTFSGIDPFYCGLVGGRHLLATFTTPSYADMSRIPTANISDPDNYCAMEHPQARRHDGHQASRQCWWGSRGGLSKKDVVRKDKQKFTPYDLTALDRSKYAHPSQVRGRDKFLDIVHPWMPMSLSGWERAMRAVDRSDRAKSAPEIWGYWIPEPALLVGPRDATRLQRYVLNWLRAQPVWLYMLQVPGSGAVKVSTQSWRNFLNGMPDDPKGFTRTGKRKYDIKQIFGRVFSDAKFDESAQGEVLWHDRAISVIDDDMGRQILWETFELGFRYELSALDRFMRPMESPADEVQRIHRLSAVFPCNSLCVVAELPTEKSWGLFSPIPHRRVNALNALRDVLRLWPRFPSILKDAPPLHIATPVHEIEEFEMRLALFYTQNFFDVSGRAPIVPHCLPCLKN